jgi:hypothetical protein
MGRIFLPERRRQHHKKFIQSAACIDEDGDDRNSNAAGDQGIFGSCRRRFARKESWYHSDHGQSIGDTHKTFLNRYAAN